MHGTKNRLSIGILRDILRGLGVLVFLERKKQRTFIRMAYVSRHVRASTTKCLFASFSSEKEESFPFSELLHELQIHLRPTRAVP
jgi:hypothetical protein